MKTLWNDPLFIKTVVFLFLYSLFFLLIIFVVNHDILSTLSDVRIVNKNKHGTNVIENEIFVILFSLIFSFTLSHMLSVALTDVFGGVSILYNEGLWNFSFKAAVIFGTIFFSSVSFLFFFKKLPTIKECNTGFQIYKLIYLILASFSTWQAYHLSRFIFHIFLKKTIVWNHWLKNVDSVFIILYGILFVVMEATRVLWFKK